ncbi:MAG: hypothetical protein AB8G17_03825 [Gammaproteobacteria bacterium]
MTTTDNPANGDTRLSVKLSLMAMVMGLSYFFLNEMAQAFFTRQRLPGLVQEFWYTHPLLGAWLIGGLKALVVHWLIGITVGLALALLVRRDHFFFGAVATGAFLMMALQMRLDGMFALLQVGPEFWLSLRWDALTLDPLGSLSALLALPVCTWWWGKVLPKYGRSVKPKIE